MNVKVKHVFGDTEIAAGQYSPQHPYVADGNDGRVITATIRNAPSVTLALMAANNVIFLQGLRSVDFSDLRPGALIRT